MKKNILCLALIIISFNCYPASLLKKTVKPSGQGGDYTSVQACLTANAKDLTSTDEYLEIEISGTWSSADGERYVFTGFTVDATRYIHIYTIGDARHEGVFSTSKYYISNNTYATQGTLPAFTIIDGIQIKETLASYGGFKVSNGGTIKNCIFYNSAGGGVAIDTNSAQHTTTSANIYNNIIYGFASGIIGFYFGDDIFTIYNNTVYGCSTQGIRTYTTSIYKNNISYNNSTDYTFLSGAGTHSNNLAKDTSSPDNTYDSSTLTFTSTTGGSENFHLVSADTDAIDNGADLSGVFTDDIDGVTRGATWDIGADEFVSVATTLRFSSFGIGIFKGIGGDLR